MVDPDMDKLHQLVGKMLGDLGGAFSVPTTRIGFQLGIFDALSEGPATTEQLARRTDLAERYIREWALAQAANGYISFEPGKNEFSLSPEQAMIFVVKDSPVYLQGAFDVAAAMLEGQDKVAAAFKDGSGVAWGDTAGCLFCSVGSFFRPTYVNSILQEWIPALEGVEEKLKTGAKVADIGCGLGFSTLLMAEAFPNSTFIGYDFHEPSILDARRHAENCTDIKNVRFEISTAKEIEEDDFDLITVFDCLHDMGDPRGCAAHMKTRLKNDGTWMIVEPIAGDHPEENMNPVSRLYYNASTMICVPTSLAQEVGEGLGAQAGEAKIREILSEGGFTNVRRATEGPFNMILEARV